MASSFHDSTALAALHAASTAGRDPGRERLEQDVVSLFEQFRDPLMRYLGSFGLALPDREEVIQEVFLSLFQHLHSGKSRDNLRGWLFRVAHNLGLRRCHRNRRQADGRAEALLAELAVDPGPSPEDQLLNGQTQKRLLAIVDALPEQDRQCLLLRAEGLRYREIAEILGKSLGAVSLSLTRSVTRMARSVQI